MLKVEDVFERVVDGFNDATFAQQQLIKCINILILNVYQKCRYPLNAALRQQFARFFGNIAPVAKQLADQGLSTRDLTRFGTGFLSSTLPGVTQKDRISPWSLTTRCNLKP